MTSHAFIRLGILFWVLTIAAICAIPAAFAAALTDYAENKTVDALLRGQSIGTPATWCMDCVATLNSGRIIVRAATLPVRKA